MTKKKQSKSRIQHWIGVILAFSAMQATIGHASIELHAHLFMKEGMGWLFRGGFFEPLHAKSWKDRLSSQANPESVNASGIRILVATLYAHPLLTLSLKDSIQAQVDQAHRFVRENPEWILARSPGEARQALKFGKRILILALEGASGILEDEADFKQFLDRGGIRIVAPLHLTDDSFGGVAFLKGFAVWSNPITWLQALPRYFTEKKPILNPNGLTEKGVNLIQSLLDRGVWIDLAHASDASIQDIAPILSKRSHPWLFTHTVLRSTHRAERGISNHQIDQVAKTQGVLGLIPSEQMLAGTPTPVNLTCEGGVVRFAAQFQELLKKIPAESIHAGSDFNGALPHLSPGCAPGTSLDKEGLWNIGQSSELWQAMRNLEVSLPSQFDQSYEKFLDTWENASQGSKLSVQTQ